MKEQKEVLEFHCLTNSLDILGNMISQTQIERYNFNIPFSNFGEKKIWLDAENKILFDV